MSWDEAPTAGAGSIEADAESDSWWRFLELPETGRRTAAGLVDPGRQVGFVRMWRARSVDVRWIWRGLAVTAAPPRDEEKSPRQGEDDSQAQWDDLARRLSLVLQPPPETLLRGGGALPWPAPFFGYQLDGVRALIENPQLLLGDEMGLGKSVQCIAALRILLHRREVERCLLVAPSSLLEQWRREIERWAPELRVMVVAGRPAERHWQWRYQAHITLVSYDTLRADSAPRMRWSPTRQSWSVVVLDEAQRIKNAESEVAKACKALHRARSWALTGTPLENRVEELVSILEFVTGGRRLTPGWPLKSALGRYQLRRRKSEVLGDLPPKIVTDLLLPLLPTQRDSYDRARDEGLVALRDGGEARIENVLALIVRLKQICNFDPRSGASAKLQDMKLRIGEIVGAGEKVLIFTQFSSSGSGARRLEQELKEFSPLVYTGDLTAQQRSSVVDRFVEDSERGLLILSLKAGGQGLNLQAASYVFHFDSWWNPALMLQAEDRAHRLGQQRSVQVYRYVMQDTIEQRIAETLQSKMELFSALVDGDRQSEGPLFSQRELLEVVGLGGK